MMAPTSNQLRPDLLGINNLQPYPGTVSASRGQMFGSHLGQRLTISGASERYLQTGNEEGYGKATLNVKMPVDGRIIKLIPRHRNTFGIDSIELNPETLVIFEDNQTKEVGILHLHDFCTYHQYIGFPYKATRHVNDLIPGKYIAKDTVFLDTPAVTEDGGYMYGVELNTVFMTHPAVAEDGILICRDVLHKLSFKTYDYRTLDWGSRNFPLNIYGDINNYKPFPEIGDYVREDGLLGAFRTHDDGLAGVEQNIHSLMKVDHIFDKTIYASGAGGRVVDIKVTRSDTGVDKPDVTMEAMLNKYEAARHAYYKDIIEEYKRLKRTQGDGLNITPEFHRLIVEALAYTDNSEKNKVTKLYRKSPMDEYNVEYVIEYDVIPTIGYKATDCHGG